MISRIELLIPLTGLIISMPLLFKPGKKYALISKFVVDKEGNRIGETISMDGDLIIIKKEKNYLAIPVKHIESSEDKVRIRGIVEWDNAIKMGEKWKKKYQ
jgi:hypothetical protein